MFDYSSGRGLKIKVGILLDNISVVNVKFCLMVLVLPNALYSFLPLSRDFDQISSGFKNLKRKVYSC